MQHILQNIYNPKFKIVPPTIEKLTPVPMKVLVKAVGFVFGKT